MARLKFGPLADSKPVKLTVELPAAVHPDPAAYAKVLGRTTGGAAPEPAKLIAPMIELFMAGDRAFSKARQRPSQEGDGYKSRSPSRSFLSRSEISASSAGNIVAMPSLAALFWTSSTKA